MNRKRSLFLLVFLWLVVSRALPAVAFQTEGEAQDLTLIGSAEAIYALAEPIIAEILSGDNQKAVLEINDAVVEADRILVRILIWDLPIEWGSKVTDSARTTGRYLPIAELGLPSEEWLTPSSNSHYSLLSNGNQLVVAGLLEFVTDTQPDTVAFHFNQIPFETEPAAQGSANILKLAVGDHQERSSQPPLSDIQAGVTFELMNTAQTTTDTMIQPGLHTERTDEAISRIGTVSVRTAAGKRLILVRDGAYGFNLTDDRLLNLNNSYYFSALNASDPLMIGLDHVFVYRTTPKDLTIDFSEELSVGSSGKLEIPIELDEFQAVISGYQLAEAPHDSHTHPVLRLTIDNDFNLSQVYFTAEESGETVILSSCGFLPDSNQFACDLYLPEIPEKSLDLHIERIEYRIDGNWEVEWQPVGLAFAQQPESRTAAQLNYTSVDYGPDENPELLEALDLFKTLTADLSGQSGWIHQVNEWFTAIPNPDFPELQQHYSKNLISSYKTVELWEKIDQDGYITDSLSLIRDKSGQLVSGVWSTGAGLIALPEGNLIPNEQSGSNMIYPFIYGVDFESVLMTNAEYLGREDCLLNDETVWCYTFEHMLQSSIEQRAQINRYLFWVEPSTGKILKQVTECQLNGLGKPLENCIETNVLTIEKKNELDQDIQAILDEYQF